MTDSVYPHKLKEVKSGDFFTLKPISDKIAENRIFIRGGYDRTTKKYDAIRYDDINEYRQYKGDKIVYTDMP